MKTGLTDSLYSTNSHEYSRGAHRSDLAGKHMVIMGRSEIVGKPLIQLALRANMSVTVLHSHSTNIQTITKRADILVVAVGQSNTITDKDAGRWSFSSRCRNQPTRW